MTDDVEQRAEDLRQQCLRLCEVSLECDLGRVIRVLRLLMLPVPGHERVERLRRLDHLRDV